MWGLGRRDRAMTALLSGVVIVLIVCHTPKTVINIYECYQVNRGMRAQCI